MQFKKKAGLFCCFFLSIHCFSQKKFRFAEQSILLKNKIAFNLKIPETYTISVAAEGLSRPRFFSKSPDGRLFVTDMYDKTDNTKGKIYILENWNDSSKQFRTVQPTWKICITPTRWRLLPSMASSIFI